MHPVIGEGLTTSGTGVMIVLTFIPYRMWPRSRPEENQLPEHDFLSPARSFSIVENAWFLKQGAPEMLAEELRDQLYGLELAVADRVPLLVPVLPLRNTVLFPHTSFRMECSARSPEAERLIEIALDADDEARAKEGRTSRDVTSCLVGIFTSRNADVEGVLEDGLNSIGTVARITVEPDYEPETDTRKTSSCNLKIMGIARIGIIGATKKVVADPRLDLTTFFLQHLLDVKAQEPVYVKARILDLPRRHPKLVQGKSAGTALWPKFQVDLDKIAGCFSVLEPRLLPRAAETLHGMWSAITESWKLVHGRLSDISVDATASAPAEDGIYSDEEEDEDWAAAYAGTYLLADGTVDMGMIADCLAMTLQALDTLPSSVASQQILLETLDVNERVDLLISCLSRLQEALPSVGAERSGEDKNAIIMRSDAKHARNKLKEYARTPAGDATEEFRNTWIAVNEKHLDERDRMEARIDGADMPDAVRQVARREMSRLARLSSSDFDYSKTADYLDLLLGLPWQSRGGRTSSREAAGAILNAQSSGLHQAKTRVLDYMAIVERKRKRDGSPILARSRARSSGGAPPRAVGGRSKGRALGWHHDGHRARLRAYGAPRPRRSGHDGRDHSLRPRAAGGWHRGKGAGGVWAGDLRIHSSHAERQGGQ